MTEIGSVYGAALYSLAREAGLGEAILQQLNTLDHCFAKEPDFLVLLSAPNLPKVERLRILDDCFRGKLESYVLNFLKILTEKGHMRHFSACVEYCRTLYDQDNGILRVTAVTAIALTDVQKEKLTEKLRRITGKRISLITQLDPAVLGGIRLDYDGKRVDGTVSRRLETMRSMLQNSAL